LRRGLSDGLRVIRQKGPSEVQFWFIALLIGAAAAFAALLFRIGVGELQELLYGTDNVAHIHQEAARIKWYWLLAIPMFGGLAVWTLLHIFTNDGRVRAVADVIEGAALREGRVARRAGLASALASFLTLSTGGSSGREGPVVHLAAVMATYVSR
jgi:CIC family chloride channel protein